jgi:CheY-like chemotaxis protein/RNA polymerase subunit RPABC4/transcription elongation factor Spt4
MNILIVDDVAANRKLLRAQLEAEGFVVVEAADGVEALQVLTHEPLDTVISDILMPRMDGYRLCREVRKIPALHALRLILYSSTYTSPADVQLGKTVGADQFIAKPAPIAVILEALRICVGSHKQESPDSPEEVNILKQYSAVLVTKLEEKNSELQLALELSQRAHSRIHELNTDLERRVCERTAELLTANIKLTTALADVKQLTGLLPICSYCKSIRDDGDYWDSVEGYLTRHTESKFSHGVCPACYAKHITPELAELGIVTAAESSSSATKESVTLRHPSPRTCSPAKPRSTAP